MSVLFCVPVMLNLQTLSVCTIGEEGSCAREELDSVVGVASWLLHASLIENGAGCSTAEATAAVAAGGVLAATASANLCSTKQVIEASPDVPPELFSIEPLELEPTSKNQYSMTHHLLV